MTEELDELYSSRSSFKGNPSFDYDTFYYDYVHLWITHFTGFGIS